MVAARSARGRRRELRREKFLPVTRQRAAGPADARAQHWPDGDAAQARRFLRYLDYWRRHSYAMQLLELEQTYEPFSPDSDLLQHAHVHAPRSARVMQKRLVAQMAELLEQANFTRVDPTNVHFILTKDSHYGLDLQVDLNAFEEVLIYYRGATTITERRRDIKKAYRALEGGAGSGVPAPVPAVQAEALRRARARGDAGAQDRAARRPRRSCGRLRGLLPATVSSDYIYIKLFKNMPRSDVEMIFPNTKVRFRLFDKIKFGVTAGSGLGMGVFGTAGKIAVASNPYTLAGAVAGLGGVAAAPGHQLHQPAQPLHGGAGAEPLFPRHGRQPRRDDAARRPRRRGGRQGGDAALQRAGQGARSTSRDLRQVDEAIEAVPRGRPSASTSNFDVERRAGSA